MALSLRKLVGFWLTSANGAFIYPSHLKRPRDRKEMGAAMAQQRTLRFEGLLRPGLASCVRKALGQTLSRKLRAPPPNFVPLHMPRAVAEN